MVMRSSTAAAAVAAAATVQVLIVMLMTGSILLVVAVVASAVSMLLIAMSLVRRLAVAQVARFDARQTAHGRYGGGSWHFVGRNGLRL